MTGSFRRKSLSLSGHFFLYLAAMLLLIVLLWATSYYTLNSTVDTFKSVTEREFVEIRRMVFLRDVTHASVEPIYRYMAWGNGDEAGLFENQVEEVEQAFIDVLILPSLNADQKKLIMEAQREWRSAVKIGRAIFKIPNTPEDRQDLIAASGMFENHITTASNTLYEAHNIRIRMIESYQQETTERHDLMIEIMVGSFFAGLLIIAIASITMARYMLRPLKIMRYAILRFGEGELNHRIDIDTQNELGDLARGINNMAERLEQHQTILEDLAIRDSLTNLYNRREFERLLDKELDRSRRYRHPLSMLLIDIDKFKQVNDSLGHRAGDQALRVVSTVIRGICRKGDILARYGGDELAVLLPETTIEDAMILAERVRKQITRQEVITHDGRTMELTLSIGVAAASPEIVNGEMLVDAADQAMYLAKTGGRNRVCGNDIEGDGLPLALPVS